MDRFTISQLEQFSGIKSHTIRVWERRYKALVPVRSKGNTRYYDNVQLRRLLNLSSLVESGYRISELGSFPDRKLWDLLSKMRLNDKDQGMDEYYISQLIAAGTSYDERHFDKILSSCILKRGLKAAYLGVIYPVLERVGLMWATGSMPPTCEHFISNLLRQKLCSALDALPPEKPGSPTWLLFLPEDEFHEIGLLFANYLIREAGHKVIYLGSNVPTETLTAAVDQLDPDSLLLFLVRNNDVSKTKEYMNAVSQLMKKKKVFLSGHPGLIEHLGVKGNICWLKKISDLETFLSGSDKF